MHTSTFEHTTPHTSPKNTHKHTHVQSHTHTQLNFHLFMSTYNYYIALAAGTTHKSYINRKFSVDNASSYGYVAMSRIDNEPRERENSFSELGNVKMSTCEHSISSHMVTHTKHTHTYVHIYVHITNRRTFLRFIEITSKETRHWQVSCTIKSASSASTNCARAHFT